MSDDKSEVIAKYSILLVLCENGLGSILHAFQVPLSGHLLSLNQIGILCRLIVKTKDKDAPLITSLNVSILKSLGPAGKKLTPMLAILAQGFFFSLPSYIFGINIISIFIGITISSIWSFIQPVLIVYILFGNNIVLMTEKLIKGIEKYIPHFQDSAFALIIALLVAKIILTLIYSSILVRFKEEEFDKHTKKTQMPIKKHSKIIKNKFLSSVKELLNPIFLTSLIATLAFLILAEASFVTIIWSLLRPIALGILIYYLFKFIPIPLISNKLRKIGFEKTANSLDKTIALYNKTIK